tara:strand:+ start:1351 stop:1542 length:192 start_codon:yes stop_codon:yes gene_type:complete
MFGLKMIEKLMELVKQIDISKYSQSEYILIVDELFREMKQVALDDMINDFLDKNGWTDVGGSG